METVEATPPQPVAEGFAVQGLAGADDDAVDDGAVAVEDELVGALVASVPVLLVETAPVVPLVAVVVVPVEPSEFVVVVVTVVVLELSALVTVVEVEDEDDPAVTATGAVPVPLPAVAQTVLPLTVPEV